MWFARHAATRIVLCLDGGLLPNDGALGKWLSAECRPTGLGPRNSLGTPNSIAAAITVGGGLV